MRLGLFFGVVTKSSHGWFDLILTETKPNTPMTEQHQISLPDEVLNTILTGGLDGRPEAVSLLINHAMLIERHRHLGAALPTSVPRPATATPTASKDALSTPASARLNCTCPKSATATSPSIPAPSNAANAASAL